ncbi:MAG: hypothetical protein K2K22_10225, partial [Muribaculaceae bacterium]|nr:hypothetical protein [Muribaculaceae bacterium]
MKSRYGIIAALMLSPLLQSCFTGVESTPRINADDVRRQRASGTSAEALFLADIAPEAPSQWRRGKAFKVVNDRIALIFTSSSDNTERLAGHTIYFEEFNPA